MDRGVAVLLTALAGGLIALQPPINAELGRFTGNLQAGLVSFLVGTLLLAGIVVLSGKAGTLSGTFEPGWLYYLGGGVLGALYVVVALITVSSIGAAGVVAATIAGQLTASVVIDRLGVLGLEEAAVSPDRVVGIGLLLLGTYLIVR
jgi:bacterial/archaeal transporter family-2 protein